MNAQTYWLVAAGVTINNRSPSLSSADPAVLLVVDGP